MCIFQLLSDKTCNQLNNSCINRSLSQTSQYLDKWKNSILQRNDSKNHIKCSQMSSSIDGNWENMDCKQNLDYYRSLLGIIGNTEGRILNNHNLLDYSFYILLCIRSIPIIPNIPHSFQSKSHMSLFPSLDTFLMDKW